jgi:hypothetical protein
MASQRWVSLPRDVTRHTAVLQHWGEAQTSTCLSTSARVQVCRVLAVAFRGLDLLEKSSCLYDRSLQKHGDASVYKGGHSYRFPALFAFLV